MKHLAFVFFLFVSSLCSTGLVKAQTGGALNLQGQITDAVTNEPISFASIYFEGTSVGVKADIDGRFKLYTPKRPKDTLTISSIGYTTCRIYLDTLKQFSALKIELMRGNITMRDFVITVDKNPALKLIKKAIANKNSNNYDKADAYQYEVYNKLELDFNKIPKKAFSSQILLKDFSFIQSFIDTTSEDKPFLPMFLTETISDFYYQRKPKRTHEVIKGSRMSGYENKSVQKLLGGMYQNINIYDNSIPIFSVQFVSPLALNAPNFYNFTLTDTQVIHNKLCYQVAFSPKREGEHTFYGDIWIHDTDYAVQKINLLVTKDQQINWVSKVTLMQEFSCFEDTLWFLQKDKFFVDFVAPQGEKLAGFIGRKTTTYRNIVVNDPNTLVYLDAHKNTADIETIPEALDRNEDYWNSVRHETLSKNEQQIYRMIDTIQQMPVYKKYYNRLYFLSTGIKEVGPLELGSIYNLISANPVEGLRIRFTVGTTPKLFKDVYLNGYIAYGQKDQRWKYKASALWLLKREPRSFLYAEIKHDLDNSVSSYYEGGSLDNIFSFLGRRPGIPWKLAFVDKQRLEYAISNHHGFRFMLSAENRRYTPYAPLPAEGIFTNRFGQASNSVKSNELGLEIRYCYKEQFVEGNYYRTSLGSTYPLIKFYAGQGFKNVLRGDYTFTRMRLTISDFQPMGNWGGLYYTVFGGKTWGTLPYNLLEIMPGNEFYYGNRYAFNMMMRYEYLSDLYTGAFVEHSLGAFFFKYIPYIRDTRIRTFWNAKAVYGRLSPQNELLNLNSNYPFQSLARAPYVELGTGIENIFRFLRIDVVYRAFPTGVRQDSPVKRLGFFGSAKFDF